jgi:hypothetical protein
VPLLGTYVHEDIRTYVHVSFNRKQKKCYENVTAPISNENRSKLNWQDWARDATEWFHQNQQNGLNFKMLLTVRLRPQMGSVEI